MSKLWIAGLCALTAGCAHQRLSGGDLDRVDRPAFISRIEDEAGPRAEVFRGDGAYGGKLKKLEPKEADRRLMVKLQRGMTRFELSDRLRSTTLAGLPREAPWTNTLDPAAVAGVLESFLVEEVPANPPDYSLLEPLGADAVVEFVVEEYGMHSRGGRAGAYVRGYARMFLLDGRTEIWRRPFREDELSLTAEHLDPFQVGKDPDRYRQRMVKLLDRVARQFIADLNPPDQQRHRRRPSAAPREEGPRLNAPPDDTHRTGRKNPAPPPPEDELPPGELPDPD